MKAVTPRALAVEALEPYRLRIQWDTGESLEVDVGDKLRGVAALAHILDPSIFRRAHAGEWGLTVEWEDTEFGADNVYAWTREQMGEASHEMFNAWMDRHKLSLDAAAEALGLSRRMAAYYRAGRRPIPKTVWLACKGWEAERKAAQTFSHRWADPGSAPRTRIFSATAWKKSLDQIANEDRSTTNRSTSSRAFDTSSWSTRSARSRRKVGASSGAPSR